MRLIVAVLITLFHCSITVSGKSTHHDVRPPRSSLPTPSSRQLAWQQREIIGFHHFGVNTYTDQEWGDGSEDPNIFQPVKLNTTQWVETMIVGGFKEMILVTKHHDGFMLFPSTFSNHTVGQSSWLKGKGDVVRSFVTSCGEMGMPAAFYFSPWDRFYYNMTWRPDYNDYYERTMTELVTEYGEIVEFWWDGANINPGMTHYYDWHSWLNILRSHQPNAVGGGCGGDGGVYDCGPDTTWIGNESGEGSDTFYYAHSPSVEFPQPNLAWVPAFCDVSIRPGWFWHAEEDSQVKSLSEIVDIYFNTVGKSCVLQFNVPPNRDGLLSDPDVKVVREFGNWLANSFAVDLVERHGVLVRADNFESALNVMDGSPSTYWQTPDTYALHSRSHSHSHIDRNHRRPPPQLELRFPNTVSVNTACVQENLSGGQVVAAHTVEVQLEDSSWKVVSSATTVGQKRLTRFDDTLIIGARLTIVSTIGNYSAQISHFGFYHTLPVN